MRQRLVIFITVVVVLGVLVALSTLSYAPVEKSQDEEWSPDRSTYNPGQTGTRALYDFLSESGYQVMRWREAPAVLLSAGERGPRTFVVIGRTIVPFTTEQTESLLHWVEGGGRLVIIDRRPDARLLASSGDWHVATELLQAPSPLASSDNPEELTANVKEGRPTQPTLLTRNVNSVIPSRFASLIKISTPLKDQKKSGAEAQEGASPGEDYEDEDYEPPPAPAPSPGSSHGASKGTQSEREPAGAELSPAPVVHLTGEHGALLADYAHGRGRIVILSDPFIVANNGIKRADNLLLAINMLTSAGGLVAFDEFHQGHGSTQNELFAYFRGTPLLPMLLQGCIILLALLWTRGRRFARPLPLPQVDRRSKLEFVASMAELQQRARAYDLAIENIYTRLRRVLARYAGVDHLSTRAQIAAGIAARSKLDQKELEALMRDCEESINGAPTNARKALTLVARLREVENRLALRMRSREIRQAKER